MKTIAAPAMAAIEAGTAIVTGAVEILPVLVTTALFGVNATFDYQIIGSVIDADPPSGVTPPSSGFSSSGNAPFGLDAGGLTPFYPIVTAWLAQTSLWLKKDITTGDGTLTLSGHVENGAVFFIDDVLIGSVNADNSQSSLATGIPYSLTATVTAGAHVLKILVLDEATDFGGSDNTYFYCLASETVSGSGPPIRVWGGYGPIDIDGETYEGIGARGLAQQTAGAVGGIAQGLTLTLSGIEPTVLALLDASEIKRASVVVRRLIFAGDGKTLLDFHVWDRGRVDTIDTAEEIGGEAAIRVAVESAARGLGRAGGRRRADSDQRLIDADDGYFDGTAYAGQKTLYWGGKKPSFGGASTGGGSTPVFRGVRT